MSELEQVLERLARLLRQTEGAEAGPEAEPGELDERRRRLQDLIAHLGQQDPSLHDEPPPVT